MSIKRILKRILKPLVIEILQELIHDNVQYKNRESGIEIKANFFFENMLKERK